MNKQHKVPPEMVTNLDCVTMAALSLELYAELGSIHGMNWFFWVEGTVMVIM